MKRTINPSGKPNCGRRVFAAVALCAMTVVALPAQNLTRLYGFCSKDGCVDGEGTAALIRCTDGNLLYGAAAGGGANDRGTFFDITRVAR